MTANGFYFLYKIASLVADNYLVGCQLYLFLATQISSQLCVRCGCVADNEITAVGEKALLNALAISNTLSKLTVGCKCCVSIVVSISSYAWSG